MTRIISTIAAALVATSQASVLAQDSQPVDAIRSSVKRAVDWIDRQAIPVEGEPGAIVFPESAGGEQPEFRVYGGTAGVLIFLENAAHVLKDEPTRKLADDTARGLLATGRALESGGPTWSSRGPGAASLYIGDAGIGHAFLVRARLRKDKAALSTAVKIGDAILLRGKQEGDTLKWPDGQTDIIYGAAGTLLFLLELGAESGEKRFAEGAVAAGRWLVKQAVTTQVAADSRPRRLSWPMGGGRNRHMPNFSHGTAGISYALARVGAATGDATCTEAAKDGAAWLIDHAIQEGGGLTWPAVEGGTSKMAGWCHGPPGTARLFLFLYRQTGDQKYLDVALASARWVIGYADAAVAKKAAIPPGFCCGVAGALDFFCDLYRATGKQEFADFARRAGDYLVGAAVSDGEGVKWRTGASAHGAKEQDFGVDLMLGASGEAFALLRLLTLTEKQDPVISLPDRATGW